LHGESPERFYLRVVTKDGGYRIREFSENLQVQSPVCAIAMQE
jgi:hypothetical protein